MAGPTFSAAAWEANLGRYAQIRDMPFNRELGEGTLSPDRFRHYIIQDAHYLVAFGQALAVSAAKADDPDLVARFASAAEGAILVERGLHTDFVRAFGLEPSIIAATPVAPTCHHYASFLLATAFREPLPVAVAAMLPCFWVYREVGRHILATAAPDNAFQPWIDTYAGQEFAVLVDQMIGTTDAMAEGASETVRTAMHRAFTRAAILEWMFWDAAYRCEAWPL